jgi:hypothetical protein
MIDIKFIAVQDLLTLNGARYANITPRSLILEGEKFLEATRVVINDIDSPEFMIVSNGQIIAQVPKSEVGSVLRKVAVLAEKPVPGRKSLIHFDLGKSFKTLQGIERTVQIFIKLLLQTPGSDKFEPTVGGGLLMILGKTFSKDNSSLLQSQAVTAVNRTRDQIVSLQTKNSRIPSDERLLTANIEAVGFNALITSLTMRVILTMVSGRQAVANLSF